MSRIGKKPIALPAGVKAEIQSSHVRITGPKGTLNWEVPREIEVVADKSEVKVSRRREDKKCRALHGLSRSLIANMVHGVTQGYQIRLQIFGTGYGCDVKGRTLELSVGFMGRSINKGPQFSLTIPEGVEVVVENKAARGEHDPARMVISGIDKQRVGQFAAEIRRLRKPEPYKGKGIRYEGEYVRRKQGKALAGGG